MIAQFRTLDDKLFLIDFDAARWYQPSELPKLTDAGLDIPEGTTSGKLIPHGFGAYALEGRTPKDGVCMFGMALVPMDRTLVIIFQANVPIKDPTMPVTIETVLYQTREQANGNPQSGAERPQGEEKSENGGTSEGSTPEAQPGEAEASMESGIKSLGA